MSRSSSIFRGFAKTKRHAAIMRHSSRYDEEEEKQSRSSMRPPFSMGSMPEIDPVSAEPSETEWEDEDGPEAQDEAKVKEALKALTKDFSLLYKDVKDDAALKEPPLAGVPASRLQTLIRNQRQARARRAKTAQNAGKPSMPKLAPKSKRPQKETETPEVVEPQAKRLKTGAEVVE